MERNLNMATKTRREENRSLLEEDKRIRDERKEAMVGDAHNDDAKTENDDADVELGAVPESVSKPEGWTPPDGTIAHG